MWKPSDSVPSPAAIPVTWLPWPFSSVVAGVLTQRAALHHGPGPVADDLVVRDHVVGEVGVQTVNAGVDDRDVHAAAVEPRGGQLLCRPPNTSGVACYSS